MTLSQKIRLFFYSFIFLLSSCTHLKEEYENEQNNLDKIIKQKIYTASYEAVWKAAHRTISYTISTENQDFGFIETDFVKAVDGWMPPFQNKPKFPSSRYKLIFTFAKGKTASGQNSVRLTIDKKIEVFKDFISEVKNVESDGLEEQAIFYRIERELIIEQALKKALEQN